MEFNKIYNVDCLEFMKGMESNSIDLTVTSPPYDNLRIYNNSSKWDFEIFKKIASELFRITKIGGVVVWVVGDATINGSESGTSFKQALFFKELGFNLHDTMIYLKKGVVFPDSVRYYNAFEYMFIFSKGSPKTFNPICDKENTTHGDKIHGTGRQKDGTLKKSNGSKIGRLVKEFSVRYNYWFISSHQKGLQNQHPASFPYYLAFDHIVSWSNEFDLIFDPFLGSGTTAVACIDLKRKYLGCEIDKEYFEIAEKRIENQKKINKSKLF